MLTAASWSLFQKMTVNLRTGNCWHKDIWSRLIFVNQYERPLDQRPVKCKEMESYTLQLNQKLVTKPGRIKHILFKLMVV